MRKLLMACWLLCVTGCSPLDVAKIGAKAVMGASEPSPLLEVKQQTGDNGLKGSATTSSVEGSVGSITGGDTSFKVAGANLKASGDVKRQIGGDSTEIKGAHTVQVTNVKTSQLFWYTLVVIAGCFGWTIKTTPQDLIARFLRRKK